MGKEVEKSAIEKGHTVLGKVDKTEEWKYLKDEIDKADVVIDFSLPESAVDIFSNCFDLGVPVVTGTTGWYDRFEEVNNLCKSHNGTIFYAPNFSIGVNLFFLLNQKLAKTMSAFDDYKVRIEEIHHIHKIDAPSGTAIKLAEDLIDKHGSLEKWINRPEFGAGILPVLSERKGEVPGTHLVKYESEADMIEIKHEAKNRSGFAKGAVSAAEWVFGKKGIFTMDDMLNDLL